jgi:hypothetical protein
MFGLPVRSTRSKSLRAYPSWVRAAGLVGAAMLLASSGVCSGKAERSRYSSSGQQAGGICRFHYLPGVSRGHLQRLSEEPSPGSGNR